MKLKLVGNMLVITSSVKAEAFKRPQRLWKKKLFFRLKLYNFRWVVQTWNGYIATVSSSLLLSDLSVPHYHKENRTPLCKHFWQELPQ